MQIVLLQRVLKILCHRILLWMPGAGDWDDKLHNTLLLSNGKQPSRIQSMMSTQNKENYNNTHFFRNCLLYFTFIMCILI